VATSNIADLRDDHDYVAAKRATHRAIEGRSEQIAAALGLRGEQRARRVREWGTVEDTDAPGPVYKFALFLKACLAGNPDTEAAIAPLRWLNERCGQTAIPHEVDVREALTLGNFNRGVANMTAEFADLLQQVESAISGSGRVSQDELLAVYEAVKEHHKAVRRVVTRLERAANKKEAVR
jgi:hypothetical protein